jgi:predicted nucleic-acid-binding protein
LKKLPLGSIAVDTNVLLRALVDDDSAEGQTRAARAFLAPMRELHVSQVVQVELTWVLRRAFGFDRDAILKALRTLREHPAIRLQAQDSFDAALGECAVGIDFADALIAQEAHRVQTSVVTFDRIFAKRCAATLLLVES